MRKVRAKKHLGQHFLNYLSIAKRITDSLVFPPTSVIEVGPGMGVLTQYLVENKDINFKVVEIDCESVEYLNKNFPQLKNDIVEGDFLQMDLAKTFSEKISIIGNFPYNISNQIFFKVYDNRNQVEQVVGMVQREVGRRIASGKGSKEYGILSVLLQSFYDAEYLFTVDEDVFTPPPKVKSAVIRLTRNKIEKMDIDEKLFLKVIKAAFNQRRKMLRNSLSSAGFDISILADTPFLTLRPEQISVADFQEITRLIEKNSSK